MSATFDLRSRTLKKASKLLAWAQSPGRADRSTTLLAPVAWGRRPGDAAVKAVQEALVLFRPDGIDPGKPDGKWKRGGDTQKALRKFQELFLHGWGDDRAGPLPGRPTAARRRGDPNIAGLELAVHGNLDWPTLYVLDFAAAKREGAGQPNPMPARAASIRRLQPKWNSARTLWLEGGVWIKGTIRIPIPHGTTNPKEIILSVITAVETSTYDDINVYDRGILTWGINQWTVHAGSLQGRLRTIKQAKPELFKRLFSDRGVDVDPSDTDLRIRLGDQWCTTKAALRGVIKGDPKEPTAEAPIPWTDAQLKRMERWAGVFFDAAMDGECRTYQHELAVRHYEGEALKKNFDNYSWAKDRRYGKFAAYLDGNLLLQAMYCGLYVNNPKNAMQCLMYTIDHYVNGSGSKDPSRWGVRPDDVGEKYIAIAGPRGLKNWPERLAKQKARFDELVGGRALAGLALG